MRRSRSRPNGQSLTEFVIVLPVMLALLGATVDVSRLYFAWVNLESGTRDAAQYLATSDPDPLDPDYSVPGTAVPANDAKADYILELATSANFSASGSASLGACNTATFTTEFSQSISTSVGGSEDYPVGTARVQACLPFQVLFDYPFLTVNGAWVLRSDRSFSTIIGR